MELSILKKMDVRNPSYSILEKCTVMYEQQKDVLCN